MDIRDFDGMFKYKLIIPFFYVISWLSMFLGPSFFQVCYQKISIAILGYLALKTISLAINLIILNIQGNKIFKKIEAAKQPGYRSILPDNEILFGFIIPNYNQEIQMLSETLRFLAKHKKAKNKYLIFLAMEAHEPRSQFKAYELIQKFKKQFFVIDYTLHQMRQYEQKGKAANVSWCGQHLQPIFQKHMINHQHVLLTVMDADSWAPEPYFEQIQEYLLQNPDNKDITIFQAPQMFTRNYLEVPIFTRVYDLMHVYVHASSLFSFFDITFPLSNYTISYQFIKKIGFWDTCPDAIGQDFHTTQKAYWKSNHKMIAKPIYVPFNQVNISTGNGYIQDVKARFWQAQRHAQGVADAAYNTKMFFNNPFELRNLVMVLTVLQICLLPTISPWVFLSFVYQSLFLHNYSKPSPQLYSDNAVSLVLNISAIFSTSAYFLLEIFIRRANRIVYGRQNASIFRLIEYPLVFTFNMFLITVPTFAIAAFSVLSNQREYVIAQKKNAAGKEMFEPIL